MTNPLPRLTAALADRYRIERELGEWGVATVYLAQDPKHDLRVAIKVLRPELAAVNLQHLHILGLTNSGDAGGSPARWAWPATCRARGLRVLGATLGVSPFVQAG